MRFAALIATCVVVSCGGDVDRSTAPSSRGGVAVDVLVAAVSHIAVTEPVAALVAGDALPKPLLPALDGLRLPVYPEEEISTTALSLPAGHLIVRKISISGDAASVVATLGPIPAAREGVVLLSCGSNYHMNLARRPGGQWRVIETQVMVC